MSDDVYAVSSNYRVNWAPANVVDEVLQNVATIISTPIGSVPYDRDLGISAVLVDSSTPVFIAKATREVIQKISKYEPRAIIYSVSFDKTDAADGLMKPRLEIGVKQ